ncbi:MAG TPA: zinc-dependent peptidase [Planctomycetaceae bacterium]|nr:zinc-dependent peptidase [Planctomycetaceae bacterium]
MRKRRRRRWLAEPFPAAWEEILQRHVKQARRLPPEFAAKWRQRIQVFVNATSWEGCRGFAINEEVRVVITAYATLLVLGLEDEWFDRVRHVLVHPTPYQARRATIGVDGVDYSHGDWLKQLEDDVEDEHLGEAWFESGTVILVWSEVPTADHITPPGQNVVVHEFAHVLHELLADRLLAARTDRGEPWLDTFTAEFDRQVRSCDRGRRTLLDDYAAESPEEFFCVATECFLERPDRLRSQCPTLSELLRICYGLDPANWNCNSE